MESEEIGTIGVGESTVPPIVAFHKLLGIDERDFMRECAATFKVAIWFENWGRLGDWYLHPFGRHGQPTWMAEFYNYWLHARSQGLEGSDRRVLLRVAGRGEGQVRAAREPACQLRLSLRRGAVRALHAPDRRDARRETRRGKIKQVRTREGDGYVESLELEDGKIIAGDFFIDCTGFRGLLIEGALKTGYEDFALAALRRAVAFQTIVDTPAQPYTACYAHTAGWRWNIPVQHRVGNGVVYCSRYMSDDEARQRWSADSGGRPVKDPWLVRIKAGRRKKAWNKNVVCVRSRPASSSRWSRPASTPSPRPRAAHESLPVRRHERADANHYNALAQYEIERIRDFVVMHYHYNQREDAPFWKECREMEIPDSLRERVELFSQGRPHLQAATASCSPSTRGSR